MEGAARQRGAGAADALRGAGGARRDRCRRACRPQFRGRTRRAGRQCVRGGHQARAGAASRGQARRDRALERGRARAHEPRARRPQTAQSDAGRLLAAGAGVAQAGGGARRARHRVRLRDRRRRHRQRAGHSRRPAGAAAPRHAARRQFHRRGHQSRARRSGRARRSRHRPLCRLAADHGAGAPHDCLEIHYAEGAKLFLPVENVDLLSRYGAEQSQCRSRPARRRQLAGAQGAHEEPHPRDRRRTDQGRRRAAVARGAAPYGRAGRL